MQNIPTPIVSRFKEINIGKYRTTQHFEVIDKQVSITEKINLAKDRQFAKSLPEYWLSYRINNRWRRITGLFKIGDTGFYKGDTGFLENRKHLIIAFISHDTNVVTIYTFKNYFTQSAEVIFDLIKNGFN